MGAMGMFSSWMSFSVFLAGLILLSASWVVAVSVNDVPARMCVGCRSLSMLNSKMAFVLLVVSF